ncbi:MAG: hypothetical protein FWC79_07460 [Oscillospiraceae bacterium]|nr:hypothetical protein [Oscillospiraceae bacterium]
MPSCLGIYVGENVIKYAKVSKERERVKVEAAGVKFYENTEEAIKEVISETFSDKTPISINLINEKYVYADVKDDPDKEELEEEINTEFERLCDENGEDKKNLEYRKILAGHLQDANKKRVIYSYVKKIDLFGRVRTNRKS